MTKDEALKLALEALDSDNPDIQLRAATALRQAIEQAEKQEPVDWKRLYELEKKKKEAIYEKYERDIAKLPRIIPMEATPQREWAGLTDEEIVSINDQHYNIAFRDFDADVAIARAIEAKLKAVNGFHSTEKNT